MMIYSFNPMSGNQMQFTQLQRGIGFQYAGNIQYGLLQMNSSQGYLVGKGPFGQVNLFVNPSNPFSNAQQYLRWSGLDAKTLGELEKILATDKKAGKKTTAIDVIKVVFEGVGKVTDLIRAWKGDRNIAYDNTGWTPTDFGTGAGGGADYNPFPTTGTGTGTGTGGGIGNWVTNNKELIILGLVGGYLILKSK